MRMMTDGVTSGKKEMCLLFLEKAIAKHLGGYAHTQYGSVEKWMAMLTGGLCNRKPEMAWDELQANLLGNNLVFAEGRITAQKIGVSGHYGILDARLTG